MGIKNHNMKQKQTQTWIKELKDLSWQAEMIISGGLIFALMQLPNFINTLQHQYSYLSYYIIGLGNFF